MDRVRVNLYKSIILSLLRRPPSVLPVTNLINYRWNLLLKRSHVSSSPISIVLYVNKTCNYKCSFCYNQKILSHSNDRHELTPEILRNILSGHHGSRALRLAFMGGEPFLNKHLFDLIQMANDHRKITNVVTNCSVIEKDIFQKIKKTPITLIGMSLYSNNLSNVQHYVRELNHMKKRYWVQTICDATDLASMEKRIFAMLDVGCTNLILSNYNPFFDSRYDATIVEHNSEYLAFEKRIKRSINGKMNIQWVNRMPKVFQNKKKVCTLPFSYIHLDTEGSIGPCCFRYPSHERFGKIKDQDGWNSPEIIALRKNMMNSHENPIDECVGCENLYRNLYSI